MESVRLVLQTTRTTRTMVGGIARAELIGSCPASVSNLDHDEQVCDRCLILYGLIGLSSPCPSKRSRTRQSMLVD
jgi:hypothetical protein